MVDDSIFFSKQVQWRFKGGSGGGKFNQSFEKKFDENGWCKRKVRAYGENQEIVLQNKKKGN